MDCPGRFSYSRWQRKHTGKNYHWGSFTAVLFETRDKGFETIIIADNASNVIERLGFNVFILKYGILLISDQGVLGGISANLLMK